MIEYKLKTDNSDFLVTEVLSLELKEGEFSYYLLQKSGLKTMDVVDIISEKFNIRADEISFAGLKDEDAVTTQYIAIKNKIADSYKYTDIDKWFSITYIGNSDKNIEIGHLFGNAFKIKIRNLSFEDAVRISEFSKHEICMINYYDVQRFGKPKFPKMSYLIGQSLLEKDYEITLKLLYKTGNITESEYNRYRGKEQQYLFETDRRKLDFFLSSWDSFIWNKKIHNCIMEHTFAYERICRDNIDFIYAKLNDKIRKSLRNINICRHFYTEDFSIKEKQSFRQPYINTVFKSSDIEEDDIFINKYTINLSFVLPSGSYATAFIDQLIWLTSKKY